MDCIHLKFFQHKIGGTMKEIRRISLPKGITFDEFCQMVRSTNSKNSSEKHEEADDDFKLEYEDSEKDLVTITCAHDWEECLQVGNYYTDAAHPLRLHVKPQRAQHKTSSSSNSKLRQFKEQEKVNNNFECSSSSSSSSSFFSLPDNFKSVDGQEKEMANVSSFILTENESNPLILMQEHRYLEALRLLKTCHAEDPSPVNLYNMACCLALLHEPAEAIRVLEEAWQQGYRNIQHLLQDEDLESLHVLPEFQDFIQRSLNGESVHKSEATATATKEPENKTCQFEATSCPSSVFHKVDSLEFQDGTFKNAVAPDSSVESIAGDSQSSDARRVDSFSSDDDFEVLDHLQTNEAEEVFELPVVREEAFEAPVVIEEVEEIPTRSLAEDPIIVAGLAPTIDPEELLMQENIEKLRALGCDDNEFLREMLLLNNRNLAQTVSFLFGDM